MSIECTTSANSTVTCLSMRDAVARWDVWVLQRREWAQAHGVDEDALKMTGNQPWDEAAI